MLHLVLFAISLCWLSKTTTQTLLFCFLTYTFLTLFGSKPTLTVTWNWHLTTDSWQFQLVIVIVIVTRHNTYTHIHTHRQFINCTQKKKLFHLLCIQIYFVFINTCDVLQYNILIQSISQVNNVTSSCCMFFEYRKDIVNISLETFERASNKFAAVIC